MLKRCDPDVVSFLFGECWSLADKSRRSCESFIRLEDELPLRSRLRVIGRDSDRRHRRCKLTGEQLDNYCIHKSSCFTARLPSLIMREKAERSNKLWGKKQHHRPLINL